MVIVKAMEPDQVTSSETARRPWRETDRLILQALKEVGARALTVSNSELVDKIVQLHLQSEYPWLEASEVDVYREIRNLTDGGVEICGDLLKPLGRGGRDLCKLVQQKNLAGSRNKARGLTLSEAYASPRHVRQAVEAQIKWKDPVTARAVVRALRLGVRAPSNFPPVLARWAVDRYCPQEGIVSDPCAGFGGRLVGSLTSSKNVHYWGREPVAETFCGLQSLVQSLAPVLRTSSARAHISQGDAASWEEWPRSDLILTSPPYFDTELYVGTDPTKSAPKYSQWRVTFLEKLVKDAAARLSEGGHLFLVLKDVIRNKVVYPLEDDTRYFAAEAGLKLLQHYKIMGAMPKSKPEIALIFRRD